MSAVAERLPALRGARPGLPQIVLALGLLVVGAAIFQKVDASLFYYDEWTTIVHRRGTSLDTVLRPHNDHLNLLTTAVYKVWLVVFGLDDRWPYALLAVGGNLACGVLVYLLLAPRTGPWPAVAAALVLVSLGPSWENLLWPFQFGLFVGIAAVLAALLALERGSPRSDLIAAALLVLAIISASIALVGLVAATAHVVASRRAVLRRLIVVAGPAVALYGAWYVAYRDQIRQYDLAGGNTLFSPDRLFSVPDFVASLLGASAAATTGLTREFGAAVLVAFVVWVAVSLVRTPRVSPLTWALVAAAVSYPVLTGLGRYGQNPESSRYLYPAVALLLVLGGLTLAQRPARRALAVTGVVATFAIWSNLGELRAADQISIVGDRIRVGLTMLELARDHVPPDFQPDATWAPDINARVHFELADRYGSAAATLEEVARSAPEYRVQADLTLARALGAGPVPAELPARGPRPAQLQPAEAATTVRGTGPCAEVGAAGGVATVSAVLPATGFVIAPGDAGVDVRLRRFGDGFSAEPLLSLAAGATARLAVPPDRAPVPWHVQLASTAPYRVCSAG